MTHHRLSAVPLVILLSDLFSYPALATSNGGVGLSATRMIFPASSDEERMGIKNTSDKNVFLMQSWMTDSQGNKTTDLIITPPLFVLKPGKEGSLRVTMARTHQLPSDRESLFYLNSKAIPSIDKSRPKGNSILQIATQSIIKVFVRPTVLKMAPKEAPGKISCRQANGELEIRNDSPYYITLVNIKLNGKLLKNIMVAPFSFATQPAPKTPGSILFQTINDYGGITPAQLCK